MKNLLFILLLAGTGAQAQTLQHNFGKPRYDIDTAKGIVFEAFDTTRLKVWTDSNIVRIGTPDIWITDFDTTNSIVFDAVDTFHLIDCEPYEDFTEWQAVFEGNERENIHVHSWVYAEREDVNSTLNITLAIYCPCGCPQSENQARICSGCLRHETRVRSYGSMAVERKGSDYVRLKKKIKE